MALKIRSFEEVVSPYRGIFFDSYGVLKNYQGQIEGMAESLRQLEAAGKTMFVLTNDASRSPAQLAAGFHQIGLTSIQADQIISSGMLAREYLRHKIRKGRIAYLGTDHSAHYLADLGLAVVSIADLDLSDCKDVSALVLLDDEGFDWSRDLHKALNLLRRYNVPAVVANTDETYPVAPNEVNIAIGGIADMLEAITNKQFIRFGKPDSQIFTFAFEHMQQVASIERHQILMVGDTLHTDILGGNKYGLDTALVLTGNTAPDQVRFQIRAKGIQPTYICPSAAMGR
jgi:HAD superfamily hydrolase (TIGR01450 family)